MQSLAVTLAAFVLCTRIAAQPGGWEIRVSNDVSPSQPTATIEVWAWFVRPPTPFLVFGAGDFDLRASEGGLTDPLAWIVSPPNQRVGTVLGDRIVDVLVWQWLYPPTFPVHFDQPLKVWSATWGTDNFAPRNVDFFTENTSFFNLHHLRYYVVSLFPDRFTPGAASIRVVPAPAAGVVLAWLGCAWCARRGRQTG